MTDTIHYTSTFDDGSRIELDVILDSVDLSYRNPPPSDLPKWTKLEYLQC